MSKKNIQEKILYKYLIKQKKEYNYSRIIVTVICLTLLLAFVWYYKQAEKLSIKREISAKNTKLNTVNNFCNSYTNYLNTHTTLPVIKKENSLNDVITNLNQVQEYMIQYLTCENKLSSNKKEEIFKRYIKTLAHFENYSTYNILKEYENNDFFSFTEKRLFDLKTKVSDVGLKIYRSEGVFYLSEDKEYTYKKFAKYLPVEWQEYLKIRSLINTQYYNDAYVAVSADELKNIIMAYEKFYNKYPNFTFIQEETPPMIGFYTYIGDFINNKSFYYNQFEYYKAYKEYLQEYPETKLRALLEYRMTHMDIENSWDAVEKFYKKVNSLNPYFPSQDKFENYSTYFYFDFSFLPKDLKIVYQKSLDYCIKQPMHGTGSLYICQELYIKNKGENFLSAYLSLKDFCYSISVPQAELSKCMSTELELY